MAELKNEFSWSWSRHRAHQDCLRKYWFQHYGFWGGWSRRSDPEVREIYIQKRLNTVPQWVGVRVHEAAEWVLGQVERRRYPPPEHVVERARMQATRQLEDSALGRYRLDPKRNPGLVEHYYEEPLEPGRLEAAVDEIVRQVGGLFDNPVFLRLASVPERIREVERLERVLVGDVPVWVSLDVLVDDGEGGLVIIDWKTGRAHDPEAVSGQLGVYGLYVLSRYFGTTPAAAGPELLGRIQTMYVNLREAEWKRWPLRREDVDRAVETIRASAAGMRARLRDVEGNVAEREDFPPLPEGDPACVRCAYRRSCGR